MSKEIHTNFNGWKMVATAKGVSTFDQKMWRITTLAAVILFSGGMGFSMASNGCVSILGGWLTIFGLFAIFISGAVSFHYRKTLPKIQSSFGMFMALFFGVLLIFAILLPL